MTQPQTPQRTVLHGLHLELGAKMVPFAGYEMPVQYPLGILKEHLHTRARAGLFDVSHMGQIRLSGDGAALALETLVPVDVLDLAPGAQRYGLFTNDRGGVLDDLMVTNLGTHLLLVVNAACKQADLAHLQQQIGEHCEIEMLDRSLIALQGPEAARVLAELNPQVNDLVFMQSREMTLLGTDCVVSRSGYTGEDGFEIAVDHEHVSKLAKRLLEDESVEAIGLGARDSLRLEAGLCLYGHELDPATTPVEAALTWALSKARRPSGARAGGYPGADVISAQLEQGASRRRVGLSPEGRAPVREGAELRDTADNNIGSVTSGGFGPSVGRPVAMGYVAAGHHRKASAVKAIVRNKPLEMTVSPLPFFPIVIIGVVSE